MTGVPPEGRSDPGAACLVLGRATSERLPPPAATGQDDSVSRNPYLACPETGSQGR